MAPDRARAALAVATVLACVGMLAACVPESARTASPSTSSASEATDTPTPSASPSPTSEVVAIPTDCRAMLTPAVLAQLEGQPLNDPASGVSAGVQPDGSLVCVWGMPADGTSFLITTVMYMSRGPALDRLNALVDEGYSCYTPSGGTRCEKTWFSEPDLLPEGRTLFWRDDILIDTQFTNLAPAGYTDAIVDGTFPAAG